MLNMNSDTNLQSIVCTEDLLEHSESEWASSTNEPLSMKSRSSHDSFSKELLSSNLSSVNKSF